MTGRDPFDFSQPASPPHGPVRDAPPSTTSAYGPSRSTTEPGHGGWNSGGWSAPEHSVRAPEHTGPWTGPSTGLPNEGTDDLVGRPPLHWLVAAAVLGIAAAVLAGVDDDITLGALAWVLAGPLGIALVAVYSRRDVAARARPVYDAPVALGVLRWSTGIALAVGIVASALRIAAWAGRL